MTFISEKKINGKKRKYLEKSIRLPDNTVKKISVYLKDGAELKIAEKELQAFVTFDVDNYGTTQIFTEKDFKRIEDIRLGYKKIISSLTVNQINDIIDRFTVNFTYETNAIEGSSLTLKDVTIIIKEGNTIRGKELREIYETVNTRDAIDLLFRKKPRLNAKSILNLHTMLVKNTGVSFGYKKFPNFLLNRYVQTTKPEKVKEEMNSLIEWYHQTKNIHPLQKAGIFHGRFEKIHPFEDGNGRVGRLLINLILLEHRYPPLIIRKTQRIAYFNALEAFDNNHPDRLLRFLVEKYKDTYDKFFRIYVKYL